MESTKNTKTLSTEENRSTALSGGDTTRITAASHLAETTLGINPVRVLLAVRADVPLPLAHEARGVGEAPVLLLGLWACP